MEELEKTDEKRIDKLKDRVEDILEAEITDILKQNPA